jgi:hypothetical protein
MTGSLGGHRSQRTIIYLACRIFKTRPPLSRIERCLCIKEARLFKAGMAGKMRMKGDERDRERRIKGEENKEEKAER